jgi:hypothetical protein
MPLPKQTLLIHMCQYTTVTYIEHIKSQIEIF